MLKARIVYSIVLIAFVLGCATERIRPGAEGLKYILIKEADYDGFGRPLFSDVLKERPSKKGEQYTLVLLGSDGRPTKSFDIAIIERSESDILRPLKVIYKWTGKGFKGGLYIAGGAAQGMGGSAGSGELGAAIILIVVLTPIVAGTAGGFVVGFISSIPDAAAEINNLIVSQKETLISYSVYEHDERNRLTNIRIFTPSEQPIELFRTDYFYNGESSEPYKTEVTSLVEETVREITPD